MAITRRFTLTAIMAAATLMGPLASTAHASAAQLAADGRRALDKLYATEPKSRLFADNAKAVLVFPTIIKGGLVFGAQTGNGVLFVHGRPTRFYNVSAASWGLQIGGQSFSSAMFFMNARALRYLHKSGGFAIGSAPNVVVVDHGAAVSASTTTLTQDVYVFTFAQKGLMAGIDIHGSKITPINPK